MSFTRELLASDPRLAARVREAKRKEKRVLRKKRVATFRATRKNPSKNVSKTRLRKSYAVSTRSKINVLQFKYEKLDALKKERGRLRRELLAIEKKITKENVARKRRGLQYRTKAQKLKAERARRLQRNLKSLTTIRKKVAAPKVKIKKTGKVKVKRAILKSPRGPLLGEKKEWSIEQGSVGLSMRSVTRYLRRAERMAELLDVFVTLSVEGAIKRGAKVIGYESGKSTKSVNGNRIMWINLGRVLFGERERLPIQELLSVGETFNDLITASHIGFQRYKTTKELKLFRVVVILRILK